MSTKMKHFLVLRRLAQLHSFVHSIFYETADFKIFSIIGLCSLNMKILAAKIETFGWDPRLRMELLTLNDSECISVIYVDQLRE